MNRGSDQQAAANDPGRVSAAGGWRRPQGAATTTLLLRHGQTEMSVQGRFAGRGDVPLTDTGARQAVAVADRLSARGADLVVSSPLSRARHTAQAVAEAAGAPLVVDDDLAETDFGAWEGLTFAEAAQRDPELHRSWLSDPSVPAPDGESFDAVHARVSRARDELVAAYQGCTVLVVSHVTPIKTLLRIGLDAGPNILFRLHLDLASLSIVEFYPDGNASVRLVNDTAHLS